LEVLFGVSDCGLSRNVKRLPWQASGRVLAGDDARGGATQSALGLLWLGLFD
jgi:hypothetical protein